MEIEKIGRNGARSVARLKLRLGLGLSLGPEKARVKLGLYLGLALGLVRTCYLAGCLVQCITSAGQFISSKGIDPSLLLFSLLCKDSL